MAIELVQIRDSADVEKVGATFDDFWLLYPRRVAKKDAQRMWARMSEAQRVAALVACVAWRPIWARKELEYIAYPASWLNGERWEDELPQEAMATHASHVAAVAPAQQERGEIPAHVKAMLARLRK